MLIGDVKGEVKVKWWELMGKGRMGSHWLSKKGRNGKEGKSFQKTFLSKLSPWMGNRGLFNLFTLLTLFTLFTLFTLQPVLSGFCWIHNLKWFPAEISLTKYVTWILGIRKEKWFFFYLKLCGEASVSRPVSNGNTFYRFGTIFVFNWFPSINPSPLPPRFLIKITDF